MSEYTEKQLLEWAAKAYGIRILFEHVAVRWVGEYGEWPSWNPLHDDGDALRLAVQLGLEYVVDREPGTGTINKQARPVRVRVWASGWHKVNTGTDSDPELLEAIRLAIVRAAAEIGRAMP